MKIGIVGHFAKGENFLNGQTIKTKIVADNLEKIYNNSIIIVDTHNRLFLIFTIVFRILFLMIRCKNIIIMPAQNGLKIISPIINFWNIFFKRKIHYCVIGGWLAEYIKPKKKLVKICKKFAGIYVETKFMKDELNRFGFSNVIVMPNFKSIRVIDYQEIEKKPLFKYCTFSRVMKEKGIVEAIEAISFINNNLKCECYLDIYGQIDDRQIDYFNDLFSKLPKNISYKGTIPYDQSTDVLKDYYGLLFPTYYDGEGFAGTLIDGLSAGLPIIATNWKYNNEIIDDSVGILVEPKNVESLVDAIIELNSCSIDRFKMYKKNCLEHSKKYQPEEVIKILIDNLSF